MPLSDNEIARLIGLVEATREHELNCDECLDRIADLVENQSPGQPDEARFQAVRQHLLVCEECRDEYDLLRRALQESAGGPDA